MKCIDKERMYGGEFNVPYAPTVQRTYMNAEQTKEAVTVKFGKFKGKKLVELPGWYLCWLAYNDSEAHAWVQMKYPSLVQEAERVWHSGQYEG